MNRLLLDTNVVLDVFLEREINVEHSIQLWRMAELRIIKACLSVKTLLDVYYILGRQLSEARAKEVFADLASDYEILDVTGDVAKKIPDAGFDDYEDAAQFLVAEASDCRVIVTRNKDDFTASRIPVFSPEEYLRELKNE